MRACKALDPQGVIGLQAGQERSPEAVPGGGKGQSR